MNHRHLLPNEIDLLVDGEAGFGVAPLRAHLDECPECSERFEEALFVVTALEELPHFAPDSRLADRVMAQVPVFVPAHVAARDSVLRWVPSAGPARLAAAALVATVTGSLTLALVWAAMQGESALFIAQLLGDRLKGAMLGGMRDAAVVLLGEPVLAAVRASGTLGAALLAGALLVTAAGTVAGLRRLATANRRS